jgi:hypothetical protein
VLAAPGCGAALPSAGADPVPDSGGVMSRPIRAVVIRECGESGTVRGDVLAFGGGVR